MSPPGPISPGSPSRLAVAICTHNPRRAYLQETVEALRHQSLAVTEWDLLVVDNASDLPISRWLDLAWHPRAWIEREEKLGTAHARHHALARLREYELLLFVDDDNLLAPDYLELGRRIGREIPGLGCWGGQLIPRYESTPPAWMVPYRKYLAIWEFSQASIACIIDTYDLCPPTAGCFIRNRVRTRYLKMLAEDPRRLTLGAKGDVQIRGEDLDLVLTAIDLDLALGRIPELRLVHCLPSSRLQTRYLAGLLEGTACGTSLLEYLRGARPPELRGTPLPRRMLERWRTWRLPTPFKEFYAAELRGARNALKLIRQWELESGDSRT
jgi:GT2 family glycosyltransferase